MADQSIIRSAAQSFAVLSYNDTPIYPTPSDPLDPPEQPQPPEQNDGAGDVEENAPPSPQDETMRKARKDRAPNKKAIAIAEHVRKWLTEQVEQERKEFEAIWLGKGDVLSSSDDARNLTETIVAKTGFVVPAGDVRAWLTAFTGLPRALDWIYKHDHRTSQPTSDSPPPPNNLNDVPDTDATTAAQGPVPAHSVGPRDDINVADWVAQIISKVVGGDTTDVVQPANQTAIPEMRPRGRPPGGRGRGQRGTTQPRRQTQRRNGTDSSERRINVREHNIMHRLIIINYDN